MRIIHFPTNMLIVDFYTKPLQGKQFRIFRNLLLNLDDPICNNFVKAKKTEKKQSIQHNYPEKPNHETNVKLQECVGNKVKLTYKDIVCKSLCTQSEHMGTKGKVLCMQSERMGTKVPRKY